VILRALSIGDLFYPASQATKKNKTIFRVAGPNEFSSRHGSPVRRCVDMAKKEFVNKSSRLEVVKQTSNEKKL